MSLRVVNMNESKKHLGNTPRWHDVGDRPGLPGQVCPSCGRSVRSAYMGDYVQMACVCGHTSYQMAVSVSGPVAFGGYDA
jgi:hypothetical protein